jgi:flagellar biosynthesis protein FlhB
MFVIGRALSARLGDAIVHGCAASDGADLGNIRIDSVASTVLSVAVPLLGASALTAVVAHVAQTRALWLPVRRIRGAPAVPRHRGTWTALHAANVVVLGGVTIGWLWLTAPQIATLVHAPDAVPRALGSFATTLAIAWVALATIDALLRRHHLAQALQMTRVEKREDDRMTAADPRWRAQRLDVLRSSVADLVARSALVLVGDNIAVAIAWDARRQPVPIRTATGRHAHASQILALARRHRIAIHRDVDLAKQLVGGEGPVPDSCWPRLAEIFAATGGR